MRDPFTNVPPQCTLASKSPAEMNLVEDVEVVCPHCGSAFVIQADTEAGSYTATEDCAICCRPIVVRIRCRPGETEAVDVERG
jgi:transcription elongation factor Elf1